MNLIFSTYRLLTQEKTMENMNAGQENRTQDSRKPYQTPQLINLGEIQAIVQAGPTSGPDGPGMSATGAGS
jgi:hypothetical protein